MRTYSQRDEDNIRDQALVEDWIGSGLLNADQDDPLHAALPVTLRRTHGVLRAVFALFTILIIVASVGLTMNLLHVAGSAEATIAGVWAVICLGLAWLLATQGRLYRCGVEEALSVAAVVLFVMSLDQSWPLEFSGLFGTIIGTVGSFGIYALFRFRYALAAGVILAGLAPFALSADSVSVRSLSLLVFAVVFYAARLIQQLAPGESANDDWTTAQATAFAGFYLVLNLMITPRAMGFGGVGPASTMSGWFYWLTYVMAWIVPAAGLWLGIRERVRLLIDASAIALLVSVLTNKAYLGWTRNTWDPIVLGVLLIVAAVLLRRRLASEPLGFTPLRLLDSQNRALSAASALSLALPQTPHPTAEHHTYKSGGGQSGGGGASGDF